MGVDDIKGRPIIQETLPGDEIAPGWFTSYSQRMVSEARDPLNEIRLLSTLNMEQLNSRLGGPVSQLPYEVLSVLMIEGTDDSVVADVLRKKREVYLKTHPEAYKGASGADVGVITYDGRFISQKDWQSATESEKRAVLVGSTCFHFNSDTPGMGSDPNDRW